MVSALLASLLTASSVRLVPFESRVAALAFAPQGTLFAGTDSGLVAWNPRSNKRTNLAKADGTVSIVVARAEEDAVYDFSFVGLARWTPRSGTTVLHKPRTNPDSATIVALSSSGRTMAVEEESDALSLFQNDGKGWRKTRIPHVGWPIAFVLDDQKLAFARHGSLLNEILTYDLASGRTRRVGKVEGMVRHVGWADGGSNLLCASDLFVEKLDAKTGRSLGKRPVATEDDPVMMACPSPLGGVWTLSKRRLRYIDAALQLRATERVPWRLQTPAAMACASDGKTIAVADGRSVVVFTASLTASVKAKPKL